MLPKRIKYLSLITLVALLGIGIAGVWLGNTPFGGEGQSEEKAHQRDQNHDNTLPEGARARLGSVRFVQPGEIKSIAALADGHTLVTTGEQGPNGNDPLPLHFWDAASGSPLRVCNLQLDGDFYRRAFFSPDHELAYKISPAVVPSGEDRDKEFFRSIDVMEVRTGKRLRGLGHFPGGNLETFALSPDGKLLAAGGQGKMFLWDTAADKEVSSFPMQEGYLSPVFSPDNKLLAFFGGNIIRLVDTQSGKEIRRVEAPVKVKELLRGMQVLKEGSAIDEVVFSPDGALLVYKESLLTELALCEVSTGKEIRRIPGGFTAVTFSPDNRYLAAIAYYYNTAVAHRKPKWGDIHLWEVATGKLVAWFGKERGPTVLAFSPDSKFLWSGGSDGKVRRWELPDGKLVDPGEGHGSGVTSVTFSPAGKRLISVADVLCLWDVNSGKLIRRFGRECYAGDPDKFDHISPKPTWLPFESRVGIKAVAFAAGGKHLVSWGWDEVFRHWDPEAGKELLQTRRERERGPDFRDKLSPDGKTLAMYCGEGDVFFLDPSTGKEKGNCDDLKGEFLGFSPDGRTFVALDDDKLGLWEVATGKRRLLLEAAHNINDVAFSSNGRLLVSSLSYGLGGNIHVWDLVTGKAVRFIATFQGVRARISPDNTLLAFAFAYGPHEEVVLWNLAANAEQRRLQGHLRPVFSLTFSPDGKTLASGSSDGTILLWDVPRLPQKVGEWPPKADGRSLQADELDRLWDELAGADAARAFQAILALAGVPGQSVPLLRERLQPVAPVPPEQLARLLTDLDNDRFGMRERATRELEELGLLAEPALRQALLTRPSLEVRRRIEGVLEKLSKSPWSPDSLRGVRAVEALEDMGTGEARKLLAVLARGAPEARLTQEAQASLERLAGRPLPSP
jgi:WD40 repeat protein